jgi:hypothetical protein
MSSDGYEPVTWKRVPNKSAKPRPVDLDERGDCRDHGTVAAEIELPVVVYGAAPTRTTVPISIPPPVSVALRRSARLADVIACAGHAHRQLAQVGFEGAVGPITICPSFPGGSPSHPTCNAARLLVLMPTCTFRPWALSPVAPVPIRASRKSRHRLVRAVLIFSGGSRVMKRKPGVGTVRPPAVDA